jgi:hypothetical protein
MPRVNAHNKGEEARHRRPLSNIEREQLRSDAHKLAWELIAEESDEERPRPSKIKDSTEQQPGSTAAL